ncbi:helix-turn-helix transcriptional regulator [Pedobacter sp. GR22-10]|uniref:helix-turn-helix transcriptional regulator n=1 Tax=Pedobacter sp. GR22-10 TaxID=2994472 RepID=UPI002247A96F|nr:helix-turn-helix transcriptional regulator [Pedobacter sp. GR22-10]MCX2433144.1 helix-turn-helix transcriptional regulator [Pedobacter sp. GR22-10]
MLDIGNTLRRYRDKHQYTQQYVANIIGISRVAYRKWENNEVDFALSQLMKIAELYEVPIHQIILHSKFNSNQIIPLQQKGRQYY